MAIAASHAKLWDEHCKTWASCCKCPLSRSVFKRALFRGHMPCDILFVGEGPGRTEDMTGHPFDGLAGRLLDQWIGYAQSNNPVKVAMSNLVACRPCVSPGGPNRTPSNAEIETCADRLAQLIAYSRPELIITVGRVAETALNRNKNYNPWEIPTAYLIHPAAVLRVGGVSGAMTLQDKLARKKLRKLFKETARDLSKTRNNA